MDDVEPQVRAPLARVGVVLHQRVHEHPRVEVVVDAARHQLRDERAGRQLDVVDLQVDRRVEVLVEAERRAEGVAAPVAVVELADRVAAVERKGGRAVGAPQEEPLVELVAARLDADAARAVDGERLPDLLDVRVDADLEEPAVVEVERQMPVLVARFEALAVAPLEDRPSASAAGSRGCRAATATPAGTLRPVDSSVLFTPRRGTKPISSLKRSPMAL